MVAIVGGGVPAGGGTVSRLALVGVLFDGPCGPRQDTAATPKPISTNTTPTAVATRPGGRRPRTPCAGRPEPDQPVTVCSLGSACFPEPSTSTRSVCRPRAAGTSQQPREPGPSAGAPALDRPLGDIEQRSGIGNGIALQIDCHDRSALMRRQALQCLPDHQRRLQLAGTVRHRRAIRCVQRDRRTN